MAAHFCRMYNNTEAFTNNAVRLNGLGYVYVRGVVFSELCCSSTQCFVMKLHVKLSLALHRLHKVYQNKGTFGVKYTPEDRNEISSRDRIDLHNCDMMEFRRFRGNSHFLLQTCSHFGISRKFGKSAKRQRDGVAPLL